MKSKMDPKDRPYVENYPPLKEWLDKNNARCDWQSPVGPEKDPVAYVEQWYINGKSAFLVTIRSNQMGWEIFTSGNDVRIPQTLKDAEERIARRPWRAE